MDDLNVKIHAAEARLLQLTRNRNSLVPAASLPENVLLMIFAYFPASIPEDGGLRTFYVSRPPTYFAITHTCHRWRTVYCTAPRLWSNVNFRNLWLGWLFLQRSYPALIHLVLHPYDLEKHRRYAEAVLETILEQIPRAESMEILDTHYSLTAAEKILAGIFSRRAPFLERLSIHTEQSRFMHGPNDPEYLDLRSTTFFREKHPVLSALTLKYVNINWETALLRCSLTYLCIQDVAHELRPPMSTLLEVLSGLPELRQLDLTRCLPAAANVNNSSLIVPLEDRVKLQRVSRIRLHCKDARELGYITSHIVVPLSAHYIIICEDIPLDVVPPHLDVFNALGQCVLNHTIYRGDEPPDEPGMDCLRYLRFAGPKFGGSARNSSFCWSAQADPFWETPGRDMGLTRDLSEFESDLAPRIQVDLIWTDLSLTTERVQQISLTTSLIHAAIVPSLPLSTIRHVILSDALVPVLLSIAAGLPRAHNVESLTVYGASALRAIYMMQAPAQDFIQGPRSLFPKLKRIAIHYAHLEDHFYNVPERTLWDFLEEVLRARATAGAENDPANPIEQLRLAACGGISDRADVQSLAELVQDLDWDRLAMDEEAVPDMLSI